MEVTLNVLRCPDSVVPEMRRVTGGEYRIGRGADNDWVLPDPDKVLSKLHCVVQFHNGGWQVRDTSTNGTFHNGSSMPIGRDLTALLQDGDRIRLGPYEIEVRVQHSAGMGGGPAWSAPPPAAQPQWDVPLPATPAWNADPGWSPGPSPSGGRPEPIRPRMAGDAFPIGGTDAPPLPGIGPGGAMSADPRYVDEGPAMPDHVSPMQQAFFVPAPLPPAPGQGWPPAEAGNPGHAAPAAAGQPPPGWSLDLNAGPAPAAAPPFTPTPPASAPFPPAPVTATPFVPAPVPAGAPFAAEPAPARAFAPEPAAAFAPSPPVQPTPPPGPAPAVNPFEHEASLRAPGLGPIAPPLPVGVAPPVKPLVPEARPAPAPAPPAAPMPPAASAPAPTAASPAGEASVAPLLAGLGIAPTAALMANPDATLRAAGAALRAAIAGLRALLIARADVKREFRIEATMLGAANNPVKFSHNDDAALVALLGSPAVGPGAVADAVNDLTAHQVATLAATQAAARALLDRLAPAGLEAADAGGSLLGPSREKRLWEAYKRLHDQVGQQFEDDFDSAFGKAFARAYEQALRDGRR